MTPQEIADALRDMAKRVPMKPRITLQDLLNDREPDRTLVLNESDTEQAVLAARNLARRFRNE